MIKKRKRVAEGDPEEEYEGKSPRMYFISMAALAASVLLCVVVTVQTLVNGYVNLFGYSVFRVVTGSMEPTIPVGAVLISKNTDIDDIETGDIICFRSREASHYGSIVTHRVVSVSTDGAGVKYLESRGDANNSSDPYFVQEENLIGRVIWYTEKGGVFTTLLSFLSGKIGFLALIVIPVLLIAGLILYSVGRNIRGELDEALEQLAKEQNSPENQLLPGYKTLTVKDYNDIYETLKRELWKELHRNAEASDDKTEYPEGKNS
ncbi:MAG: signal peptidase I [Clostridia bacterium]|nr:signal peptidase I [Clostridia bacterium]